MRTKYGALRTISIFYKVLAVIIFILSLALAVVSVFLLPKPSFWAGSMVTAVTWAVLGSLSAVSIYASGEFITLLIDMEANTRASRILLTRMMRSMPADPARGIGPAGVRRQPAPSSSPEVVGEFMPDFDKF